jgi:hypothetical protein
LQKQNRRKAGTEGARQYKKEVKSQWGQKKEKTPSEMETDGKGDRWKGRQR